jgi:hypothetical protein
MARGLLGQKTSDQQEDLMPRRDRVREHTAPSVNARIDTVTSASVEATLRKGPDAIQHRLAELDAEWDIDRALMVNFAVAGGTAFSVGMHRYATSSFLGERRKGFLYFFGAQLAFLLVHGIVGWCPPAGLVPTPRRPNQG